MRDHHRLVRISMMVDEVRNILKKKRNGNTADIRDSITPDEFAICGGHLTSRTSYSLYRQLVEAKRDALNILCSTDHPFSAKTYKMAHQLYEFYPSDDELLCPPSKMDHVRSERRRVAYVLRKARTLARNKELFSASSSAPSKFYDNVVRAKRFMRSVLERGGPRAVVGYDAESSSSTDAENVDHLDDDECAASSSSEAELID